STAYMAAGNPRSKVLSIEGCKAIAEIATEELQRMELKNVEVVQGKIDEKMQECLDKLSNVDFVFIDGNHTAVATLQYFDSCFTYANDNNVFVFDDIRWTREMEIAWERVKAHEKTTVSLDLFFVGIVFIRPHQAKDHFVI